MSVEEGKGEDDVRGLEMEKPARGTLGRPDSHRPRAEKFKVPFLGRPGRSERFAGSSEDNTEEDSGLLRRGGATSLALACYHGDVGRVADLLSHGREELAHEVDEDGRTALHFAAYQSAVPAAWAVIDAVLKNDALEPFKTRLHELRERTSELERSLVSEADHRLCEQWLREERTRLCLDFEVQCTAITCNLLSRADRNGRTPLHYAATTQDDTLCDLLKYPLEFTRKALSRIDGTGGAPPGAKPGFIPAGVLARKKRVGGHSHTKSEEQMRHDHSVRMTAKRRSRKLLRRAVNAYDSNRNYALHFAAASGSTSAVRELLRLGSKHTLVNSSGQTAIDVCEDRTCRATLMRLPQAVDEACDIDFSLNSGADEAKSPQSLGNISSAGPKLGSSSVVSLLEHGESVNAVESVQGTTALHRACSRGAMSVVRSLVDAGAEVSATDSNGWSSLHCCAYYSTGEHCKIARMLLDSDVDVEARTLRQRTPLHLAVIQDHVSEGYKGGVHDDDDVDENTRAHRRMPERKKRRSRKVSVGVCDMVELLARRGADLEARDVSGRTALHFACRKGDPRVVHSLLVLGANVYATTRNKMTSLHIAVEHARRHVVRLLVRYDAENRQLKIMRDSANRISADVAPDQRTRDSLISLWEACEDGRLETVRKLLLDNHDLGDQETNPMQPWLPVGIADTTLPNRLSCLHLVARGAGKYYTNAKKAFDNARRHDRGARSDALQRKLDQKLNGFRQIAKLLMRRGCKSGKTDRHGMTPIMVAAKTGAVGLISIFASKDGAGFRPGEETTEEVLDLLEKQDKEGNTAMHYAMAFRQIAAANALEVLGADVLQENSRGETTTAVAGIGVALASHLDSKKKRKQHKQSSKNPLWRTEVTNIEARGESGGKRDEESSQRRPSAPPSRPSRPSASRPAPQRPTNNSGRDNKDGDYSDDYSDGQEDGEGQTSASSVESSSRLVAVANEVAAEERMSAAPPSKPSTASRPTGVRRPTGNTQRPSGGVGSATRPGGKPNSAGQPSRPTRVSRPSKPKRPASDATSVLKSVAADLD